MRKKPQSNTLYSKAGVTTLLKINFEHVHSLLLTTIILYYFITTRYKDTVQNLIAFHERSPSFCNGIREKPFESSSQNLRNYFVKAANKTNRSILTRPTTPIKGCFPKNKDE